ncbi:MAG: hypothetical protein ABEK50_09895 [bacterium]
MSLIARFVESKGIPTTSLFLQEEMAEAVPAPRMLHVKWPFGNPYGEPGRPELQAMVIRRLLSHAESASSFGDLDQPDWPWRRTEVTLPDEWVDRLRQ